MAKRGPFEFMIFFVILAYRPFTKNTQPTEISLASKSIFLHARACPCAKEWCFVNHIGSLPTVASSQLTLGDPPKSSRTPHFGKRAAEEGVMFPGQPIEQTLIILIPTAAVGLIIGKAGQFLKYIGHISGAQLRLQAFDDACPRGLHCCCDRLCCP